jgi:pyridoxal phosphate enzyme (YggS family)
MNIGPASISGGDRLTTSRQEELSRRWQQLSARVARAAAAAGRSPQELTVVAVTKTWPASDIADLHSLGVLDIGENRAQELASKLAALEKHDTIEKVGLGDIRWHFIGQLQRNKVGLIGRHCTALHTLDRTSLVAPLSRAATAADHPLDVFIQLSLDGDPQRGGVTEEGIDAIADAVAAAPRLRLVGLMAVPPLGAAARPAFARLRLVSERVQRSHPDAWALSAGMSGDLEDAVREGATHLRVGTDLLGSRA